MSQRERKIGILTSGGDAPGMNAAIRAVVRTALANDIKVLGIRRGFEGLLGADIKELTAKTVSDIIDKGGTILRTARCNEMLQPEVQEKAAQVCKILGLEAVVVIGGDGSLKGGMALVRNGVNVIGIPGTIDLDLPLTEYTVGFDTAVNTGMEAISRIRDTSSSHERCSIVEVMGRNCGKIALWCSIAGGAEEVLIPEQEKLDSNAVIKQIIENRSRGKMHNLVVVAEGVGGSVQLAKDIEKATGIETRATILGHLQRGGAPTAVDRVHASMMGYLAVDAIVKGEVNKVVIMQDGKYTYADIEDVINGETKYDKTQYDITKILSI